MRESFTTKGSERSSYPHKDETLRLQNPLYGKAEPITRAFETNRCALHAKVLAQEGMSEAERRRDNAQEADNRSRRRDSFMVKRSQPRNIMRPPRLIAYGPDHTAHAAQSETEHATALRSMEPKPEVSMMMKGFRESRRKAFLARRLRDEGFDLPAMAKRQVKRQHQER